MVAHPRWESSPASCSSTASRWYCWRHARHHPDAVAMRDAPRPLPDRLRLVRPPRRRSHRPHRRTDPSRSLARLPRPAYRFHPGLHPRPRKPTTRSSSLSCFDRSPAAPTSAHTRLSFSAPASNRQARSTKSWDLPRPFASHSNNALYVDLELNGSRSCDAGGSAVRDRGRTIICDGGRQGGHILCIAGKGTCVFTALAEPDQGLAGYHDDVGWANSLTDANFLPPSHSLKPDPSTARRRRTTNEERLWMR